MDRHGRLPGVPRYDARLPLTLGATTLAASKKPSSGTGESRRDVPALQARFSPVRGALPEIVVNLPSVSSYDTLLASLGEAA